MKISKKIVSIGSITAITAPIVVAVSCGGQSTSTNVQIKKPEIKFYVKSDSGTPDKSGKTNYGTFRIHIPELGISYQGYNSVPFKADNINTSPVNSYVDGEYENNHEVDLKYPTIIWNNNKNLNSTKGIGHDVKITITLKPGLGISSINGKKEVRYTYTVNKDKILNDMRAIEDFGILRKDEDKNAWISKARHAIKDRLNFKDPKSLKKGEHLYTFGSVTKIPDDFLNDTDQQYKSNFKFLPGDIDFSSVTEIGDNALDSLKSLPENINFSSVAKIGYSALDSLVSLPENINFSSVTEIGERAFTKLESLPENINFSSVTKIAKDAFLELSHLPENIDFSSVTEIGEGALSAIESLPENIDLSSVTKIGPHAFYSIGGAKTLPEKIRFNHKITYDEFHSAFSFDKEKYDESWFNAHRNPAKTTTP